MPGRKTRVALLIIAGLAIVVALYAWKGKSALADFQVFHSAGERFIAGESLYQAADGHYQFKYLPASALFFVSLAILPLGAAKFIWMVVVVAALGGLVYGSRKLLGATEDRWPVLVIPTILIMAKFYARELELGQANAVFAVLLVGSLIAMARGRDRLSGGMIGAAIVFKPYALIFLPYLLLTRKYRAFWSAALITAVGLLAPILRYGLGGTLELHRAWLGLMQRSTPALLTNPDNVSFFGALAKWTGADVTLVTNLTLVIAGAMVVAVMYAVTRPITAASHSDRAAKARLADYACLLILVPLVSPQGWDYVFLVATPGVLLLISARRMLVGMYRWLLAAVMAVIGLSLYDLMGRRWYRIFMDASVLTVCFVILLAYLLWLRIRLSRPAAG